MTMYLRYEHRHLFVVIGREREPRLWSPAFAFFSVLIAPSPLITKRKRPLLFSTPSKKKKFRTDEKKLVSGRSGSHLCFEAFNITTTSMQTLKRRSSPCKYKNDPSRFLGEGITFKAKLIGILEVNEARGDKMCQDALNDLKTAIRAAGEHKQRITINISIDGLRLRDEKTGDCLYHHPVHKISFIAQDMSDSRAFGYIFGSPDTGHRFFGIKTDKTASQVVISMRDLFQVVFELKKKEIEMSKHHTEQHHHKSGSTGYMDSIHSSKDESDVDKGKGKYSQGVKTKSFTSKSGEISSNDLKAGEICTSEAIADLLDLEQGINQMNKITCSDPFGPLSKAGLYDPFDDSFSCVTENPGEAASGVSTDHPPEESVEVDDHSFFVSTASTSKINFFSEFSPEKSGLKDEKWCARETRTLLDESSNAGLEVSSPPTISDLDQGETKKSPIRTDLFTELDPLGTGRVKPYVDKKDFFQDLKNPPKKVLKELISDGTSGEVSSIYFPARFNEAKNSEDKIEVNCVSSEFSKDFSSNVGFSRLDPFTEGDPFEKTDPFNEEIFPPAVDFPPLFEAKSSLDSVFEEKTPWKGARWTSSQDDRRTKDSSANFSVFSSSSLRVSLPPENIEKGPVSANKFTLFSNSPDHLNSKNCNSGLPQRSVSERGDETPQIEKPFIKCKLSNSETKREASRRSPYREKLYSVSSSSPGRVQNNDRPTEAPTSISNEMLDATTPDPPPRARTALFTIKPPPLPPKKTGHSVLKPPARPPSMEETIGHYDYLKQKEPVTNGFQLQEGLKCMKLSKEMFTMRDSNRTAEAQKFDSDRGFPVLLPPPHRKASIETAGKSASIRKNSEKTTGISSGDGSVLDIKLTQLNTNGLETLATTLGIPSGNIYNMTLQDLTKVLAEKYLNSSKEECATSVHGSFEVDFDSNFAKPEVISKNATYDKYAVFKELMETENKELTSATNTDKKLEGNNNEIERLDCVERVLKHEEDKYEALRQLSLNSHKVNDFSREESEEKIQSCDIKPEEPGGQPEEKKDEEVIGWPRLRGNIAEDVIGWKSKPSCTKPSATVDSAAATHFFPVTDRFSDDKKDWTLGDNWATFEKTNFQNYCKKKSTENVNENENSPFSSDGKEDERGMEFRWKKKDFRKKKKKDLPWRDDDESWDDYSPKESLCSDESSQDERSPDGRREGKTSWASSRRQFLQNDKNDRWAFRNRWPEETEDEFEDGWRKQRERARSYDSERRACRHGDVCNEFKNRCDQCGDWGEDWENAARYPSCWGARRKRSESDNEFRKRCDSDASDKECIWTFRSEVQPRIAKQKQYHSLARFPRECPGHCHDSRAKQRRSLGQKRFESASESRRSYEMFFTEEQTRDGSVEDVEFHRRSQTWKEGKYQTEADDERYRNREKKAGGQKSKSGGVPDSVSDGGALAAKGKKNGNLRGCAAVSSEPSVEGEPLQSYSEAGACEKRNERGPRQSPLPSVTKSQDSRTNHWPTTNGKSETGAFSPNPSSVGEGFLDFREPIFPLYKKSVTKVETATESGKNQNHEIKGNNSQEPASLLRKSDSINIFSRDKDPFEGDEFFNS